MVISTDIYLQTLPKLTLKPFFLLLCLMKLSRRGTEDRPAPNVESLAPADGIARPLDGNEVLFLFVGCRVFFFFFS